jgi:predicted CXXCH cytochrome family protein
MLNVESLRLAAKAVTIKAVALIVVMSALVFLGLGAVMLEPIEAEAAKKKTSSLCFKCHADSKSMMNKRHVHSPVKRGECTACHNPHVSRHDGLLGYEASKLCYNCHDERKGFLGKVIHEPVKKGECLACHSPHSTNSRGLLKKSLSKTCYECHAKDDIVGGKYVHPEVEKGRCSSCHLPHSSSEPGLLVKNVKKICAKCHDGSRAGFKGAHSGISVKGKDCMGCHSPHSSDSRALIAKNKHNPFKGGECTTCHVKNSLKVKKLGINICLECHKSTLAGFNKRYSHLVAGTGDNVCVDCHTPHASDEDNLMKGKGEVVCYACHADTKEFSDNSTFRHPKVKDCAACHVSHASNYRFFLSKGDETCSTAECHPTQGTFTHPVGPKIIDPRSGDSMTCATCHNPMGTEDDFILLDDRNKSLCVKCHQL